MIRYEVAKDSGSTSAKLKAKAFRKASVKVRLRAARKA